MTSFDIAGIVRMRIARPSSIHAGERTTT